MKIKAKLSCVLLLVPVLVFAGAIFAKAAVDNSMPTAGPALHKAEATTGLQADVVISDRTFIMKSIGVTKVSIRGGGCPIIDCAAPPPGCSYQNPVTDANGCLISCGTLVCDPNGGN